MDDIRTGTTLDPRLGVTLIAERAVAHVRAHSAALDDTSRALSELLRTAAHNEQTHLPRVSRESRRVHLELLVRQASREVVLCLGEDWIEPGLVGPLEPELLNDAVERGVRFRVLVDAQQAGQMGDPLLLPGAGLEWRRVTGLTLSMMVADQTVAALSDHESGGDTVRTAHPALVAALMALCESQWTQGASFGPAQAASEYDDSRVPQPARPEILTLLAAGYTDEAVARATGVSVRKLVRELGTLRQELQSETRFQMGVEATRRGWV